MKEREGGMNSRRDESLVLLNEQDELLQGNARQ